MDGVPGIQVKDNMAALASRKAELEDKLANAEEEPILIHPEMGRYYREQVTALEPVRKVPDLG